MARVLSTKTKVKIITISGLLTALLILSGILIEFDPLAFIKGIPRGIEFFASFLKPDLTYFKPILAKLIETLQIALVGTTIAAVISVIYSFFASHVTAPSRPIYFVARTIMNVLRTIPDIVLAAVFVAIFGIGALPGVLALIFFSFGIMTKLMSEDIDAVDRGPLEAVKSVGATRTQVIAFAVIPQVVPNFISYILYTFEVNVRVSIVLGLVGAGGIGQILMENIRLFQYDKVSMIILVTFIAVIIIDGFSEYIRKRIL